MWSWTTGSSSGGNLYVHVHYMCPYFFEGEAGFKSFVKYFGVGAIIFCRSACQT